MKTPADTSYPTGMKTRLQKTNFELKEGDWWANVLRDENDPAFFINGTQEGTQARFGGRWIRGHFVEVTATNDDTEQAEIRSVEIFVNPSEQTKE